MKFKKYKLIIFDFDGVIGDSFSCVVDIVYKNVKQYTRLEITKKEIINDMRNITIFDLLKKYHIPKFFVPIVAFKIKRDLSKRIEKTNLFDGILDVFELLKKKKLKWDY